MQPTQIQSGNTLLTYSLVTTPMPVQVSPSTTTPSLANLTFVLSCPRSVGTATVAQIEVSLPVDAQGKPADPTNLAATAPDKSAASISSTGTDKWTVAAGVAPGVFIFTPQGGPVAVSSQALTIEIVGVQVNMLVGTAQIKINEWAAPGTQAPPPVTGPPSGSVSFAVAKFPYGFYAGNFSADKPMIQNGQTPTLSWMGSINATYKILYEANQPIDVSAVRSWSPPQPLTHTTTFILQVSAQQGGQTATLDFNITVEVNNPSLVANDLTVLTTAKLRSDGTGLNVDASGNVGVGTTTPQSKFQVDDGSGDFAHVRFAGGGGELEFVGWPNGWNINSKTSGKTLYLNRDTSSDVWIGPVGKELVVNGSTGNVGVKGDISVTGNIGCTVFGCTQIQVEANDGQIYVNTTTPNTCVGYFSNFASFPGGVAGVKSLVVTPNDIGFYTNGRIVSGSGLAMMAHVETKAGPRVMTSPLSLEPEVHVSGKAKLSKGTANVKFAPGVSDIILHLPNQAYKVLLTPTQMCNGLAVTNKTKDGFTVQELSGGKSNATFDWLVLAQKPDPSDPTKPHKLPKSLPKVSAEAAKNPLTPAPAKKQKKKR